MSMQDEHVTEVDRGSDLFKQVQDMLDATCMEKMCGLGRDVKHKQIKHFPYNRLEAVRVYHLNNSLTYVPRLFLCVYLCLVCPHALFDDLRGHVS